MIKTCQRCGQPFDAFSGTAKYCVYCRADAKSEYCRQYRDAHRQQRREINRRWYYANHEHNLERFRRRYIESKLAVLRGEKTA